MPIYEYQALDLRRACHHCRRPFEILQGLHEEALTACPVCGRAVRKMISWCRAAVAEAPDESARVERKIKEYEVSGMWSHAAELADKHSEKVKDKNLKMRALDDYKKAGYDVDSLSKHANLNNE
jgi:putative FmdB family regulatory protein